MQSHTIAKLAWYIPRSEIASGMLSCDDIKGIPAERAADIVHFAQCYKNLKFGWDFARIMAEHAEIPFPALVHGEDVVVWRAYKFIRDGRADFAVEGALAIETLDCWKALRGQIRSLLIANDVTIDFVATKLGLNSDVVRAYEKLFFNVLDRKSDHAFISGVVFPKGRLVEAFENYLQETDLDDLMLRAGYTHGVKHVLYAAGLGKHPFAGIDAATGAADLDAMFMADGCLYAGMGWMHQSRNAMPITNARLSMQAGKMGGENTANEDALGIGDAMMKEMINISEHKARARATAAVLDVVPTIPSNLNQSKA